MNKMQNKILIIEDTENTIILLQEYLSELENSIVFAAENGKEGLRMTEEHEPDLILLDIAMPKMDGFEVCSHLKSNKKTKDIPVIFLSAFYRSSNKVKAFQLGAVDYITKPMDAEEFIARVKTQLKISSLKHELIQTNQLLEKKVVDRTLELQQKNQALISREIQLNAIFDNAPIIMMLVDKDRKIVKINKSGINSIGYTLDNILDKRCGEALNCVHAYKSPQENDYCEYCSDCVIKQLVENTFKKKANFYKHECTLGIKNRNSSEKKTFLISTTFLLNLKQELVLISIDDITERKNIELEIIKSKNRAEKSELKFKTIFEILEVGVTITDETGNIIDCNTTSEKILGISKDEHLKRNHAGKEWEIMQADYSPMPPEEFASVKALKENISVNNVEMGIVKSKNEITWISVSATPISLKGFGVAITYVDITDLKLQEKQLIQKNTELTLAEEETRAYNEKLQATTDALVESEAKFRTIANQINEAIIVVDSKGSYVYVNKAFCKMSGYSEEDFLQKTVYDMVVPNEISMESFFNSSNNLFYSNRNIVLVKKDGSRYFTEISRSFIEINQTKYTLGTIRDITKFVTSQNNLITAKEKAEKSERRYRTMVENVIYPVTITSIEGNFLYANQKACEFFGMGKDELLRHKKDEFWVDLNQSAEIINELNQNEYIENKEVQFQINDKIVTVMMSSNIIDYYGRIVVLSIYNDITLQKELNKKILQAIIETEEKERNRFARDLHDGIGPLLSAAKMFVQCFLKPNAKMNNLEIATNSVELIAEAQKAVREISFNIRPYNLSSFGLVEAIKTFAHKIEEAKSLEIIIVSNLDKRIDINTETVLYRILCECVNNTIKYANASIIKISFNIVNNKILIAYSDNGIGFDYNEAINKNTGTGLLNIQSRMKIINGTFEIQSNNKIGTNIQLSV